MIWLGNKALQPVPKFGGTFTGGNIFFIIIIQMYLVSWHDRIGVYRSTIHWEVAKLTHCFILLMFEMIYVLWWHILEVLLETWHCECNNSSGIKCIILLFYRDVLHIKILGDFDITHQELYASCCILTGIFSTSKYQMILTFMWPFWTFNLDLSQMALWTQ